MLVEDMIDQTETVSAPTIRFNLVPLCSALSILADPASISFAG